ncbi:exfoliative toxin A/B [Natronincola peptidivorans]|uniref:Exfoliative toxin A/B n=1 Tax=Natronincola peptidivorans TaxID=426128 RepID=A0A1I0A6K9_9FIRM|nr:TDT family transporter [Natronincola peptidivorans]SES88832.1 exfoliative toxin A/B [Natronincola peptidivorans]
MNRMIKKIPIPMAGLMLALASAGNLIASYGSSYRNIFGVLATGLMILLVSKVVSMPKVIEEDFGNPVIASVMPTFSMGLMILATYLRPYLASGAYGVWIMGLAIHVVLILLFTKKYIFSFNIKKVFPSYFIVYVGIVAASVTAPAFGLAHWGQYIFWFGLITYLCLLPFVLYRVLVVKGMPEPAIPTLTIFAAPASLCLAGYLNSFQEKSMSMVVFLGILALAMFIAVMFNMPKMLRLKFYPSYSAFTFPFVITAIAMKGTNAYLASAGRGMASLGYFVKFLELWAIVMVIYVFVKYMSFILGRPGPVVATDKKLTGAN